MSKDTIDIHLDNYNNCYNPGDTVIGRVECNYGCTKAIKGIVIKLKGTCTTSWTVAEEYYDESTKAEKTKDVNYTGEENYFDEHYNISGKFNSTPGQHFYPFSYTLPEKLPPTFSKKIKNIIADIEYVIRATINYTLMFPVTTSKQIVINSPLDLNLLPEVKKPIEISLDKELCKYWCWCRDKDLITFKFTLPVSGYVSGEDVKIGGYVQNTTNVNVESIKFKIIRCMEFIATTPSIETKKKKETVVTCCESGIGAHDEKSWTSLLPLSLDESFDDMTACNFINITYRLKAELFLPFPHTNLIEVVPLIIGHVPLSNGNSNKFLL
ncbi:hypothetical protein FQA39_LY14330 [Lamprigera yunnana]|nr:hypothetical protein FQA39_LY14330 [Lamprigera yunnana]